MKKPSSLTRRRFLTHAAVLAGATLGMPTLIPQIALGGSGRTPPSGRVTVGVIGVGAHGRAHLLGQEALYGTSGYLRRGDVHVLAVCDVWQDRREQAREMVNNFYDQLHGPGAYRECRAYTDFRHILDRRDIDAVLVATPAHWHATMSAMSAAAGKDIYCETPTAVTIRESQTVVEAVRRYSRVYQGGTQQRSDREGKFRRASEFVRSGRLGKLKEIYCYRDGGAIGWPPRSPSAQAVPAGLDWDLFLGPAPAIPYDGNTDAHRFDLGELNWGQHHCDIVQWATGADESGPVEVFLEKNRSGLKYADGAVVYGRPHPEEPTGATGGACFVGTEGRIAVDRTALVSRPGHLVSAPLRPNEVHLSWSEDHAEDFLEAVRTRKRPICDEMVAHRSVSALLLGGISKQLNRTLRWDPRTERFTNDDQANRLLSIATRPPWHI